MDIAISHDADWIVVDDPDISGFSIFGWDARVDGYTALAFRHDSTQTAAEVLTEHLAREAAGNIYVPVGWTAEGELT